MFCTKCGYQLNDDAKFCLRCGFPTAQTTQPGAGNNQPQQTPVVQNNAVPICQQTQLNNAGQATGNKKSHLWIIPVIAGALFLLIIVLAVSVGLFKKPSPSKGMSGGFGTSNSLSSGSNSEGYKIGDIIKFGKYEQDGNLDNGAEPIEWIVLDKDGEKLLLISRYVLDAEQYTGRKNGAAWEDSVVYYWLEYFFNSAFSYEEYKRITTGTVRSDEGTYLTSEYCFALSSDEAQYYAEKVPELYACKPTKYAINMGVVISSDSKFSDKAYWYVRDKFLFGTIMAPDGVAWISQFYKEDKYGFRPAVWITEKSDETESFVPGNRDYSNLKISGAESIDELIEILNNNEYISEATIYTMLPELAAGLAYNYEDYDLEEATSEISQKTCAQIKGMMDLNGISESFSDNRFYVSSYKKLNKSQFDYVKQSMDTFDWFDDAEEIWQTTGYFVAEGYGRQELEYLTDDEPEGYYVFTDSTVAIIKKQGRYYWLYTGNWD